MRERPLRAVPAVAVTPRPQRALIWALGLGAFGLAFAITTTAAYLPPLLQTFTDSSTMIAVILGAEGVFAISLPLVVGPWSDHFHTPLGRRRPFMLVAIPPMAFCLALLAFMPNLWTTALLVFAFFFAYYLYEPPYRGLYPDLVPRWMYGRAQSVQHAFRGLALGAALVGGGFLFHAWEPSPFILAALVMTSACGGAVLFVREGAGHGRVFRGIRSYLAMSWSIVRDEPEVRRFLIANTAWEGSFAAARTFVVLYLVVGLNQPATVSATVLATVAAGYAVAAVCSGFLGDRFGFARVIAFASVVYGGGYFAGGVIQDWQDWYYGVIFPVAAAGGVVMTLSWGLLFKLMPHQHRGAIAGLATTTKGIGLLAGPIVAGGAIDILASHLEATEGYQVLWPICGIPILAAIPLVRSLAKDEPVGRPAVDPPLP